MAKDFYDILGLSRDASADDIKKAYRGLSKQWHPDKHKGDPEAEKKFKDINEAYEVLSNPEKKQMYDQFGTTGGPGGGPGGFGGFDFSGAQGFGGANMGDFADMFESFFGGGGQRRRRDTRKGADMEVQVTIPFSEVVTGVSQTLQLDRDVVCDTCEGVGSKKGSKMKTCETCGGTGQVTRVTESFFGRIQQRAVCEECVGSGQVPEEKCDSCNGLGRKREVKSVTVDIPAGIEDGQSLRIRGEGQAGIRGAESGDLFVHVRVQPDPRFERDGADIYTRLDVPIVDALLGTEMEVETVHGPSTLKIPEGIEHGTMLRIKNKGLPVLSSSRLGDHYVNVRLKMPRKLSKKERQVLEQLREMQ